jgi:hypothetical protein
MLVSELSAEPGYYQLRTLPTRLQALGYSEFPNVN